MKKIICPAIIALLVFCSTAVAQNINLSADSVALFLCKKWQFEYALLGTMKMNRIPGPVATNYEFIQDKTFYSTGSNAGSSGKGAWSYDSTRKSIILTMRGKPNTKIISLKPTELIILLDAKKPGPDEPVEETKVVYKIKNN